MQDPHDYEPAHVDHCPSCGAPLVDDITGQAVGACDCETSDEVTT